MSAEELDTRHALEEERLFILADASKAQLASKEATVARYRAGARLTRRVREEYLVYFDRNATVSGTKCQFSRWGGGSDGKHRPSNAA